MTQLDFIGTTQNAIRQSSFLDSDLNILPTRRSGLIPTKVEAFFNSLDSDTIERYSDYWTSVKPEGDSEIFQRWLFAFMSVHTSWRANVTGYLAIRNWWEWLNNSEELERRIISSGAGLHKNRTRFISQFSQMFWSDTSSFKKTDEESWSEFRNRLVDKVLGLGMAKVSFSLEMVYSMDCEAVCMDTHLYQVYGLDQTKDSKHYENMEQHWVGMCKMWNVSPYIARCIWWDKNQSYQDSRYWSFCLEK